VFHPYNHNQGDNDAGFIQFHIHVIQFDTKVSHETLLIRLHQYCVGITSGSYGLVITAATLDICFRASIFIQANHGSIIDSSSSILASSVDGIFSM